MSDEEVEIVVKTNMSVLADDLTDWLTEYYWGHVNEQAQTDEFYEKLSKACNQFADTLKAKLL